MVTLTDHAVPAPRPSSRARPRREGTPADDHGSNPFFGVALAGVLCLPFWAGLVLLARAVLAWAVGSG